MPTLEEGILARAEPKAGIVRVEAMCARVPGTRHGRMRRGLLCATRSWRGRGRRRRLKLGKVLRLHPYNGDSVGSSSRREGCQRIIRVPRLAGEVAGAVDWDGRSDCLPVYGRFYNGVLLIR